MNGQGARDDDTCTVCEGARFNIIDGTSNIVCLRMTCHNCNGTGIEPWKDPVMEKLFASMDKLNQEEIDKVSNLMWS